MSQHQTTSTIVPLDFHPANLVAVDAEDDLPTIEAAVAAAGLVLRAPIRPAMRRHRHQAEQHATRQMHRSSWRNKYNDETVSWARHLREDLHFSHKSPGNIQGLIHTCHNHHWQQSGDGVWKRQRQ